MKLLVLVLVLTLTSAQDEILRDIGTAIKAGSAKELIKFCNSTVEIKVKDQSSNYSRPQAEVILKFFFNENPPKDFTYIHKGSSPEGLMYTIGEYTHKNGSLRVIMLIKKIDDSYLIDTLQFVVK